MQKLEVLSLEFWVLRFERRRYQLDAVSPLTSHVPYPLSPPFASFRVFRGPSFFSFSWLVPRVSPKRRHSPLTQLRKTQNPKLQGFAYPEPQEEMGPRNTRKDAKIKRFYRF